MADAGDRLDGAHLLRRDHLGEPDCTLLEAVARVVHVERAPAISAPSSIGDAHSRGRQARALRRWCAAGRHGESRARSLARLPALDLPTGLGSFANGGREYVETLDGTDDTPMPWANVIANPRSAPSSTTVGDIGHLAEQRRRRTASRRRQRPGPRSDGRSDIRARQTSGKPGRHPGPWFRDAADPRVESDTHQAYADLGRKGGLDHTLDTYVDSVEPVESVFANNRQPREWSRTLRLLRLLRVAIGPALVTAHHLHVVTTLDPSLGTVFARNAYTADAGAHTAFAAVSGPLRSATGDRAAFLAGTARWPLRRRSAERRADQRFGAGLESRSPPST